MQPYFQEVTDAIREILEFQPNTPLSETTLLEADLGMDSGLMLELIMQLEDTVPGLVVDQAGISYDQFKSVGSVCGYVADHVAEALPA